MKGKENRIKIVNLGIHRGPDDPVENDRREGGASTAGVHGGNLCRVPAVLQSEPDLSGAQGEAADRLGAVRSRVESKLRRALHQLQDRAYDPLPPRTARDAARVIVRSCEGMFEQIEGTP